MSASPGLEPPRPRGALLPHGAAHAPVRDLHDAAHARQGEEHQAQLRLAVRRRRVAPEARADQRSETTAKAAGPRTVYEITGAGAEEFEDWLAELLSTPVRDFTSLEAGLSLMPGLPPDEVARLLERARSTAPSELRAMDAELARPRSMHLPELFVVESTYRRHMLRAELSFVTELARGSDRPRSRDEDLAAAARAGRRGHVVRGDHGRSRRPPRRGGRGRSGAVSLDSTTKNPWPVRQHRSGAVSPSRDPGEPDPRRTSTIGAAAGSHGRGEDPPCLFHTHPPSRPSVSADGTGDRLRVPRLGARPRARPGHHGHRVQLPRPRRGSRRQLHRRPSRPAWPRVQRTRGAARTRWTARSTTSRASSRPPAPATSSA